MSLKIRVITPDRVVWNTSADEVVLPCTAGQLGILAKHATLITTLEIGVLRIKSGDTWKPIVVFGGFAEVDDDKVTILVNGVEEVTSNDLALAKSALEKASEQLDSAQTDKEKIEASQNLKRVSARVNAITFL
jgi:F-type H+-transporting ATPase subunit epsilon|tara:strand:- start:242 stop:640 length:399 start_codon:yes stop_codon:yes gene_type:complete